MSKPKPTPTAYWLTPALLRSLSRAGWGSLAGRENQGVRSVLRAVADFLPDKSAAGRVTALQIAEAAGLSERWTRRCLNILEDLGIIEWYRGGIYNGRAEPSFMRIVKQKLADLIPAARKKRNERAEEYRRETALRISQLRNPRFIFNGRKNSSSFHAELSTSLSPLKRSERPQESVHTPTLNNISVKENTETAKAVSFDEYLASLPPSERESTAFIFKRKRTGKEPTVQVSASSEVQESRDWIAKHMQATGCSYAEALGKLWNITSKEVQ